MWLPTKAFELFRISRESVDTLREELAAAKAERDALRAQLTVANTNFDWARIKLNQLEYEKAALFEKVTGMKVPAPEIVKQRMASSQALDQMIGFDDMGDKLAKQYGFDLHDVRPLPGQDN
jgi:hypothetical protein